MDLFSISRFECTYYSRSLINITNVIDNENGYFSGIHEWDDMDDEEFAKEKFGLEEEGGVVGRRSFGLIDEPNAENTPEERARLDEIYNSLDRALPYSFDARAYGKRKK